MKKVKVTQEQADAIKARTNKETAVQVHITDGWKNEFNKSLNNLSLDEFIRALYIGYEVEPEFKVGDWVYVEVPKEELPNVYQIMNVEGYSVNLDRLYGNHKKSNIRHATESEIAEEKTRRWWAKHGRDVWEIEEDDILEYLNDLYIVDSFDSENVGLKSGIEHKTNYAEPFPFVKKHFKVVCFASDRKDVDHE